MKELKYKDEPIGDVEVITDFLPEPSELVLKPETVKVTLSLTKESIDFFKKEAHKHHTHYQSMVRSLLDQYAHHYKSR